MWRHVDIHFVLEAHGNEATDGEFTGREFNDLARVTMKHFVAHLEKDSNGDGDGFWRFADFVQVYCSNFNYA